ncbi:DDE_3 domain-containing protein [Trichonephila clavipes]|nr:DDE_3 domain-containing protein [Trichonephila clavipes]
MVRQVHNTQNDRIWCVDAPNTLAIIEHCKYPKSVMVRGRICAIGKTPLAFVNVKINQKVHQRDIIEAAVLPWDQKYFGNANWSLQQDSAPVCKAKKHKSGARRIFPGMMSSEE